METRTTKLNGSYDSKLIVMQSESEADAWMRAVPQNVPSTHEQVLRWTQIGQVWALELSVREKPEQAATLTPRGTSPAGPATTPPTDARNELDAKSKADLITLGAEMGLPLTDKMNKPALIAAILDARTKVPPPGE